MKSTKARTMTRKLYAFEHAYVNPILHLDRERSIAVLRAVALVVFEREAPHRTCPVVVAARGLPITGGLTSYSEAAVNKIVLARHHRNLRILLHELAHALTPHSKIDHGPAFTRTLIYLLATYGRCNALELADAALSMGVSL